MIDLEGVYKKYGRVQALNNVHMHVRKGELFGLIGPDGAGKTTLFRLLTSLLLPDKGIIRVSDYNATSQYKQIRSLVGYMPARFSLYGDLSVKENISFFASLYGVDLERNIKRIGKIYAQLSSFERRKAAALSGGMKQKLALCCSLIHNPKVLILDEPTTGVDPISRSQFWEILHQLSQDGLTVVVSTSYMDEAAQCDRISFIQGGIVTQSSTPDEHISLYEDTLYKLECDHIPQMLIQLEDVDFIQSFYSFGESVHLTLKQEGVSLEKLQSDLSAFTRKPIRLTVIKPSIEDCFLKLSQQ